MSSTKEIHYFNVHYFNGSLPLSQRPTRKQPFSFKYFKKKCGQAGQWWLVVDVWHFWVMFSRSVVSLSQRSTGNQHFSFKNFKKLYSRPSSSVLDVWHFWVMFSLSVVSLSHKGQHGNNLSVLNTSKKSMVRLHSIMFFFIFTRSWFHTHQFSGQFFFKMNHVLTFFSYLSFPNLKF